MRPSPLRSRITTWDSSNGLLSWTRIVSRTLMPCYRTRTFWRFVQTKSPMASNWRLRSSVASRSISSYFKRMMRRCPRLPSKWSFKLLRCSRQSRSSSRRRSSSLTSGSSWSIDTRANLSWGRSSVVCRKSTPWRTSISPSRITWWSLWWTSLSAIRVGLTSWGRLSLNTVSV